MTADGYVKVLRAHEKLILVGLALIGSIWLVNKYLDHAASVDTNKAVAAQQVAAGAAQNSASVAKLVQDQAQQYQQMVVALTKQNQTLVEAIKDRNSQTVSQQQADRVAPLPQLAQRWSVLLSLQPTDIQNINGALSISETGARTTVEQLELVPTLQSNIKDARAIVSDKNQQIAGLNTTVGDLHQQVGTLTVQIADDDKACKAQISEVNEKARKGKFHWFLAGLAIGGSIVAHFL